MVAAGSPFIKGVQRSYRARYGDLLGLKPARDVSQARADRVMLMELAEWWHYSRHAGSDRLVQAAYRRLIEEVVLQYLELVEMGLRFEVFDGPADRQPYAGKNAVTAMVHDIEVNRRLVIWPHATLPPDHPLGRPVPEAHGWPAIVVFRGVHDAFGHCPGGYDLSLTGEERAYCEHALLFNDACRGALAAELRGPLAFLFFGPHNRRADGSIPARGEPDYEPWESRPYPEQKATLLPPRFGYAAAIDGAASSKVSVGMNGVVCAKARCD